MTDLNYWAVITAAACSLLLGKLWYSRALFGKIWSRADAGRQRLRTGQSWRVFGVGLIFSLIASTAFAAWLGPHPSLPDALHQALLIGVCFVAMSFALNYLFAHHSAKMCLVDAGYHAAQFLVFGLVLGLWG